MLIKLPPRKVPLNGGDGGDLGAVVPLKLPQGAYLVTCDGHAYMADGDSGSVDKDQDVLVSPGHQNGIGIDHDGGSLQFAADADVVVLVYTLVPER